MMPPRLAAFASRIGLTGLAIAVLCALLAVQTVRIEGFKIWPLSYDGFKKELADAERGKRDCEARHAVTRQSVADLELSLGRYVGAGKAARVAQLAAIEAQAEDNERLEAQAARIRAEMAEMEPGPGCETPDSIRNAEGL